MTEETFFTKVLKIGTTCNNRCFFCRERGREYPADIESLRREIETERSRCAQLSLTGQEPSIVPGVLDLITHAKSLDYRVIQMVTNGRMFAYRKFAEEAVHAGLTEALIPFHARKPELHDRIAGAEGAFAQTVRGVKNLIEISSSVSPYNNVAVTSGVVVNEENAHDLIPLMRFLKALGIIQVFFIKQEPVPGLPSPDMRHVLVPFLKGIDEAQSRRMQVFTLGFTQRELGPYASLRYEAFLESRPVLRPAGDPLPVPSENG